MTTQTPIRVVPFSHLDLFWTGTREECLSRGSAIISRALDLLEKHSDFRFLIETMNFLDHYVSCYPGDKPRLRRLIAEGRLEIGPLWTGVYLNLPGGETLARNALLAKRYARRHFAADPLVAHFGDLPGYTPQYPQIATLAGIRYVLMSRGGPASSPLFVWEGLDGSKTLSYFVPWGYALFAMHSDWHKDFAAMTAGRLAEFLEQPGKHPPALIHWGSDLYAPNEGLIQNVRQWNQERTPALQFSTLTEFFVAVHGTPGVPVLNGELPSTWPNIESSWPHIWPEDYPCEAALHMAEFLSASCMLHGWDDYPHAQLEDAWKALLDGMDHNQNSQGGERADQDKLQLKHFARYSAERIIDTMAWRLAAQVPVPLADAFPIVVFNSMSWRRSGIVTSRAGVFGDVRSSDIGVFDDGFRLVDHGGRTIPYVPLTQYEGLSATLEFAFAVGDLSAMGHQTFYIVPGRNPIDDATTCRILLDSAIDQDPDPTSRHSADRVVPLGPRRNQDSNHYENAFFRIDIDTITGEIDVIDRRKNEPLVRKMCIVGVEERRGNYIFNMTPSGRVFPAQIDSVDTVDNNAVWCRICVRGSICSMPFTQTLALFRQVPELSITNEIEWQSPRYVRLQQVFPYAGRGNMIRYGVPYGAVTYPETMAGGASGQQDEIATDVAATLRLCRHWVDIGDDAAGLTFGADHRMWEFDGTTLRSYMVRGAGFCFAVKRTAEGKLENIPHPPSGRYRFQYTLRPRHESLAASASYRCGWELNHPLHSVAVCGTKNTAVFPAAASLVDWTDTSLVATAVKWAEDGPALVVRAFESQGQEPGFRTSNIDGREALETNILELERRPVSAWRPFEIKTLIVE